MAGKLIRLVAIAINATAIAVIATRPSSEGPHAYGSGYGVGVARSAQIFGGADQPGEDRLVQTGGPPTSGYQEADRAP